MKGLVIFFFFLVSLSFGSYYSIKEPLIRAGNTLVMKKETRSFVLHVNESSIEITGDVPKVFNESSNVAHLDSVTSSATEESKKTFSLDSFIRLLPKGDVVLRLGEISIMLEGKKESKMIETFQQKIEGTRVTYHVKKALTSDGTLFNAGFKTMEFEVDMDGGIWKIGFDSNDFTTVQVKNQAVEKFLKELPLHPTEVQQFDFSEEPLFLSYVQNKQDHQSRLFIELNMTGKRKNLIKVDMKAPIDLFDPLNKLAADEENIGFIADIKGKELIEIKKMQLINGKVDTQWEYNPKQNALIVTYMTTDGIDKKVWSNNKKQPYYGIEGLWYLLSWMYKGSYTEKTFLMMNGAMATDFTLRQISKNIYELQKSGQTVYRFTLDERGVIIKFEFPSQQQTLTLESIENETVRQNRHWVSNYMLAHNIIEIKDEQ